MRVLAIAALCVVAACEFDSGALVETVRNRCASDGDCAEGECRVDICVDSSRASVEVAVEIVTDGFGPMSPIPSSWAYPPERFDGPRVRDWSLPETREVRGTVRWAGARVPATLRFVRRIPSSVEPLQSIPLEIDTIRVTSASNDELGFDYSARLVVGETYALVVSPTDDAVTAPNGEMAPAIRSLPPIYRELVVEPSPSGDPFRYDVDFPESIEFECDSVESSACTIRAQILTSDGETDVPEDGLQVRAVDAETRLVASSVAETAENGVFSIRLGPDTGDYLIRVTPNLGGPSFPAVSVDPAVLFAETNTANVIRIPRLDPVQYTGTVRDEEGAAVAGATLRFLSTGIFDGTQLGVVGGSFSSSTATNEDGTFGVELLPGLYSLQVTPPEELETAWGVLSTDVLVAEDLTPVEPFVVPSKVGLLGGVSTFGGDPAPGLTVLARARQSEDGGGMNRSQEVASDTDGAFVIQMDRGLYELRIATAPESGYPWLVQPSLEMESNDERAYRLVPPVPIEGRVLSSDGVPVAGVQLRAYAFAGEGDERRLLQVAETATDDEGNYRLLIAPRFVE